jgi:hypothetical protein
MDQAVDNAKKLLGKTVSVSLLCPIPPADPLIREHLPTHHRDLQVFENKVMQLVRLALFCEQKRQPLRRDEINKKGATETCRPFVVRLACRRR